jgi:predicted RNA-binding protein
MCEARIYMREKDNETQLMQDAVLVRPEGDAYLLVSLLGEQKLVKGRIEKIDFLKHTVHLSRPPEPSGNTD